VIQRDVSVSTSLSISTIGVVNQVY
jgi:hypothetical protein